MTANKLYRVEWRDDRMRVVTRDWTATLINRHWEGVRGYYKRSIVYGAVDVFAPAEVEAYDNAVTRDPDTNHKALRRAATRVAGRGLREAFEFVLEYLDEALTVSELAPRFSGTAGCSCPCSPGFILQKTLTARGKPVDVWFSATYDDSLTEREKQERRRAARAAMEITPKDRAQAVFYSLTELDAIKEELGV
jgi:hypothetical protein